MLHFLLSLLNLFFTSLFIRLYLLRFDEFTALDNFFNSFNLLITLKSIINYWKNDKQSCHTNYNYSDGTLCSYCNFGSNWIQIKSRWGIFHCSFFHFYLYIIYIMNRFEWGIKLRISLIWISFLIENFIVSICSIIFLFLRCKLIRIRSNWRMSLTADKILRFH